MDIRQLQYFMEVAKYSNFSKAANELHVTQPTLSQQISKMEKELKINLFVRSTRNVELTEAGKILMAHTKVILDEWQELNETLGKFVLDKSNTLKVALFPMSKMTNIIDYTNAFINSNPEIITEIQVSSVGEILDGMKEGAYDVAFFQDSGVNSSENELFHKYSNMLLHLISREPLNVLLYYKDPLAAQDIVYKSQLENYQIVCEKENSHNSYQRIYRVFSQEGINIGPPVAFTYSPEMIAHLIDRPRRTAFCNTSIGINLTENYPHLKCIPISTKKQINTYIAIRTDNNENKAALKFYRHILHSFDRK